MFRRKFKQHLFSIPACILQTSESASRLSLWWGVATITMWNLGEVRNKQFLFPGNIISIDCGEFKGSEESLRCRSYICWLTRPSFTYTLARYTWTSDLLIRWWLTYSGYLFLFCIFCSLGWISSSSSFSLQLWTLTLTSVLLHLHFNNTAILVIFRCLTNTIFRAQCGRMILNSKWRSVSLK